MSDQSTIRWEQDNDGVVVLTLDDPQQQANTMNERYVRSMWRLFYERLSLPDRDASMRGYDLRAQLMLPWCPIYGIGGLLIVAALEPLRRKLAGRIPLFLQVAAIAIGIYVVATVVELAGSYVCEWIMGYVPWDYSHAWGNFQGRIAPIYSMRFVVLGLIALYVLYPAITRLVAAKPHAARIVAVILLAALIGDYALEFAGVWVGVKDGLTIFGINHW